MLIVLASKRLRSLRGIIHTLWANFLAWGHHPPRETVFYLEAFLGRGRLRTQVLRISLHITWGSSCLVICRCVFVIAPWAALNDKACVLAAPSASHLLLQAPGEHTSQEQPSSRITDLAHFLRKESQQSRKRKWSLVFFRWFQQPQHCLLNPTLSTLFYPATYPVSKAVNGFLT